MGRMRKYRSVDNWCESDIDSWVWVWMGVDAMIWQVGWWICMEISDTEEDSVI